MQRRRGSQAGRIFRVPFPAGGAHPFLAEAGIGVHKNQSQVCTLKGSGERIEQRILTDRVRFADVFGGRPEAQILLEASTESEWVARCQEELGQEVIVADPNFAPMDATRSRRVKTDRRDAGTLAEACQLRAYRPAHRTAGFRFRRGDREQKDDGTP